MRSQQSSDILADLSTGKLTGDEAYECLDCALDAPDVRNPALALGMSVTEWTAFCHGTPLEVVAQWRQVGWPGECHRCGVSIQVAQFGWKALEFKDGVFVLEHWKCEPGARRRRD